MQNYIMDTPLYNQEGSIIGTAQLPDAVFGVAVSPGVLHEAVTAQAANARRAIAHTKGRGEVRGGGKKPWRQKGTGRARHASIRSPIWKGGGVAFGPTKERNFSKKINKKLARAALRMALSAKLAESALFMIDHVAVPESKTKAAAAMLGHFRPTPASVLVITAGKDRSVERAARNIPRTAVIAADSLNVRDIIASRYLVVSQDAVPVIEKTYHA